MSAALKVGAFVDGSANFLKALGIPAGFAVAAGLSSLTFALDEVWLAYDVAVDGDTAFIGAYRDDDAGESSGSAYVYVRTGTSWAGQQKLVAGDATGLLDQIRELEAQGLITLA